MIRIVVATLLLYGTLHGFPLPESLAGLFGISTEMFVAAITALLLTPVIHRMLQ